MANDPSITDTLKAALADIQQPPLPEEFYPAPGFIMLSVLLLAGFCWLALRLYRRYQQDNARRLAKQALAQIPLEHPGAANAILQLLKQYLQTRRPGHPALALKSGEFAAFLQQSGRLTSPVPDLDLLLYGPTPDAADLKIWQQVARQWLEQHRELGLYV